MDEIQIQVRSLILTIMMSSSCSLDEAIVYAKTAIDKIKPQNHDTKTKSRRTV